MIYLFFKLKTDKINIHFIPLYYRMLRVLKILSLYITKVKK